MRSLQDLPSVLASASSAVANGVVSPTVWPRHPLAPPDLPQIERSTPFAIDIELGLRVKG